jgi:rRNA-processing protein FCF1
LTYVSNKVYDDETILELAIRKNAVVISNDQYRDLKGASPRFANYLKNNK